MFGLLCLINFLQFTHTILLDNLPQMMTDEDDQNVRMPMGDRDYVAEDSDNHDDERRGENENMADLGEDESDEDESDNNDDDDEEEEEEEEINYEIVHKFIQTFSNGDYDAEFDDALSSHRSATVPDTRTTQASYNKPDNWRERNRIGLEKTKRRLQNCTDSVMRDKSLSLCLIHNVGGQQLMDNEEPIVWHEPILDECWGRLEAEIDRRKQLDNVTTDIERITIMNLKMRKERLAALVAIFISGRATNSSYVVNFNNANLCEEGIVWLAKLVDVSVEMNMLLLLHNRIDNLESARCLSRSLRSHSCINILQLSHCGLGSNPEILLVILQSDIRFIILDNNNIDSLGSVKIAEYLAGNPPIHAIDLDYNRLNDDDAILISQALRRNTNLLIIHLHSNKITSMGIKALINCVFDGSSLNAISESNHTLERLIFFSCHSTTISSYGSLVACINRLLEMDRTQKILLALRDKDSLLQYLTNVPVELIPAVLAFPLRRIDNEHQHKHLNIVYCTMRWWNMPMLYSYCNCVKSDTKRKRDK